MQDPKIPQGERRVQVIYFNADYFSYLFASTTQILFEWSNIAISHEGSGGL